MTEQNSNKNNDNNDNKDQYNTITFLHLSPLLGDLVGID